MSWFRPAIALFACAHVGVCTAGEMSREQIQAYIDQVELLTDADWPKFRSISESLLGDYPSPQVIQCWDEKNKVIQPDANDVNSKRKSVEALGTCKLGHFDVDAAYAKEAANKADARIRELLAIKVDDVNEEQSKAIVEEVIHNLPRRTIKTTATYIEDEVKRGLGSKQATWKDNHRAMKAVMLRDPKWRNRPSTVELK